MTSERQFSTTQRTPFHDAAGEDVLSRVEQHWRSLRKGNDVLQRVDLTPGPMAAGLSHCFMLERVTPTIARFRVAGQAIHSLLKMEPRGMPLSAIFTPTGRLMLEPIIFDICQNAEICEIPLTAHRGLGRSPLRGRLLLLPLKHDGQDINRMFGALVVDGKPSRRALRFDFDPTIALRSQTIQPVIRTVHEIMAMPDTPELQAVPMRRTPTHSALRLVVDNT